MWAVLGLLIGIFLGLISGVQVPANFSQYVAVAILASLDSVVGACLSYLQKTFDSNIFFSGFFINGLFAAILTYIGNLLGVDLSLAAIIVFGTRILSNSAAIRRILVSNRKIRLKKNLDEEK
ncbi:MAG: small basic family protein [Monoglobales bacterium]